MDSRDISGFHKRVVVVEAHSDIPTDVWLRRMDGERRILDIWHASRLRSGGVDIQVAAIYEEARMKPTRSLEVALRQTEAFLADLSESSEFGLIRTAGDLTKVVEEGKIGILLALEGAEPIGDGIELLHLFYRLGVRMLGFTWNQRNTLADGIDESGTGGGLTRYGREVLAEASRLGMILDVSHMAPAGVKDVLTLATGPVIASHSGATGVYNHPRNLSDELIMGIAETGGVVGVPAFPKIIADSVPSVKTVVAHIRYMSDLVGTNHVGFGADFTDMFSDLLSKGRMGSEWVVAQEENTRGLSSASDLPNLTEVMFGSGFSEGAIEGVLGKNFLRVFEAVLPRN